MPDDISKKYDGALVIGNGPSASKRGSLNIDNLFIVRVNFYYMETRRIWSDRVSLHVMSTYRRLLWDGIHANQQQGPYSVVQYAFPQSTEAGKLAGFDDGYFKTIKNYNWFDSFSILENDSRTKDIFVDRSLGALPTTGIVALALAALMGHQKVYFVGIDFYDESSENRHCFTYPEFHRKKIASSHLSGGYEKGKHGASTDIHAIDLLKIRFPEVEFIDLSKTDQDEFVDSKVTSNLNHTFHLYLKEYEERISGILFHLNLKLPSMIVGYAADTGNPSRYFLVEVRRKGKLIISVPANNYDHLLDVNSIGSGNYRFEINRDLVTTGDIFVVKDSVTNKVEFSHLFVLGKHLTQTIYGNIISIDTLISESFSSNKSLIEKIFVENGLYDPNYYQSHYPIYEKDSFSEFCYYGIRAGRKGSHDCFSIGCELNRSFRDAIVNYVSTNLHLITDSNDTSCPEYRYQMRSFYANSYISNSELKRYGDGEYTSTYGDRSCRLVVVVAHDLYFRTGVFKPLAFALNRYSLPDNDRFVVIDVNKVDYYLKELFELADCLIINSFHAIMNVSKFTNLLSLHASKAVFICHEGYHSLKQIYNSVGEELKSTFLNLPVLVDSRQMIEGCEKYLGAKNCSVIGSCCPPLSSSFDSSVFRKNHIVMVGSAIERKGISLFIEVANRFNEIGYSNSFIWVGDVDRTIYDLPPNMISTGYVKQEKLLSILDQSEVFFLSSVEDPLPLAAFQALERSVKVVCYEKVGTAEFVEDINGCDVFHQYNAESAIESIQYALDHDLDKAHVTELLNKFHVDSYADDLKKYLPEKKCNLDKYEYYIVGQYGDYSELENIRLKNFFKGLNVTYVLSLDEISSEREMASIVINRKHFSKISHITNSRHLFDNVVTWYELNYAISTLADRESMRCQVIDINGDMYAVSSISELKTLNSFVLARCEAIS